MMPRSRKVVACEQQAVARPPHRAGSAARATPHRCDAVYARRKRRCHLAVRPAMGPGASGSIGHGKGARSNARGHISRRGPRAEGSDISSADASGAICDAPLSHHPRLASTWWRSRRDGRQCIGSRPAPREVDREQRPPCPAGSFWRHPAGHRPRRGERQLAGRKMASVCRALRAAPRVASRLPI